MLNFEWYWVFLMLPLPWVCRYLLPASKSREDAALRVPFLQDFNSVTVSSLRVRKNKLLFWLAMLAWLLLLVAASRPQWLGDPVELPVTGRDLMMAVDLSGSMEIEDFFVGGKQVDRLTATKIVAGEFIERRVGDRLGLILFGRQAYLQTPLTFDRETVKSLLFESVIGLAGKETAIGDAIGLAVKRFRETKAYNAQNKKLTDGTQDQILILLTDGANTAGEVEPVKAAELAAKEGLKIYTLGIGADEMMVRSLFGTRRVNPSADLDEDTLKAIAEKTGGRYFRARDTEGLENIYRLLDDLEPVAKESKNFRPKTALYPWPLIIALVLAALILTVSSLRR
ncbi:MAG: VWA domain-containing protein [Gammaproteobacteria bacterium]|nr:VWA domain-containing protein [Gammaproteobacteria bacterium]